MRERDRWRWSPTARPTLDGNLHVTLHFLGDVARERIGDLAAGLAVTADPFPLILERRDVWKNGIAAIEPLEVGPGPSHLHRALAGAIRRSGLAVERRRYRPHVTLARDASGSTAPDGVARLAWTIERYALVESKPGGAYEVLATYPLLDPAHLAKP